MRWGKWAGQGWMTLDQRVCVRYLKVRIWVRAPEKTLDQDKRSGPGRFWAWLCFTLQLRWQFFCLSYCWKHGGSFLVTNVFLSAHHEQFPAGSILSLGFWTRCSAWCFWLWTATWLQEHLVRIVLRHLPDHLSPPPSFSRQNQALPFVCGPFGTWSLPASCTVEGGDFFLSLSPFSSSLCMGVAARSQQQCWIPAPWVKAGRLPAEEMLWKWDLLLLCRATGYFRSRLCWRYGLGRDNCSCWGKCCWIQRFPVSKAIDIT